MTRLRAAWCLAFAAVALWAPCAWVTGALRQERRPELLACRTKARRVSLPNTHNIEALWSY